MKQYLHQYRVRLTTVGPVFIGSGETILKKEYLQLKPGGPVGMVDLEKLIDFSQRNGFFEKFRRFAAGSDSTGLKAMLDSAEPRGKRVTALNSLSSQVWANCLRYKVKMAEPEWANWEVQAFIKDPYGNPYVPGSSLKGMLRTILLAQKIMSGDPSVQREVESIRRKIDQGLHRGRNLLKAETDALEAAAFRYLQRDKDHPDQAVNDALAGLIVSDSEPISPQKLVICRKRDLHRDGYDEKSIPTLRECLQPGTAIDFTITIDESLLQLSREEIMDAVAQFNQQVDENFVRFFPNTEPLSPDTVYLGGGAGFLSKTVLYPMYCRDEEGARLDAAVEVLNATAGKHNSDLKEGVSPRVLKTARYNGKNLQYGQCTMAFLPD